VSVSVTLLKNTGFPNVRAITTNLNPQRARSAAPPQPARGRGANNAGESN